MLCKGISHQASCISWVSGASCFACLSSPSSVCFSNNNALTLEGNEDIPASPGVNGTCLYEEPNSSFDNNYTMEPTKAAEYVTMGEKMDNEYEILVTEKRLGN